jgi:zinc and cadmium transporter
VAIGAGFQAGSTVGAVVAVAVLSHDFADGFNTYTITSLLVTIPQEILGLYLRFLAGVLLYLATSDILPVDVRNGQAQPRRREAHGHP